MNVDLILPYVKRYANRNPGDIFAYVLEHKSSVTNALKATGLFKQVFDDAFAHEHADFVFVDYNRIKDVEEPWSFVKTNGWIVFVMNQHNWSLIKKFRQENRISSFPRIAEDLVFFQKEDYANRKSIPPTNDPAPLKRIADFYDEPGTIPVPDPSGSHLKIEYIQKYGQFDAFVETGTYLGQTVELIRNSGIPFETIYSIELEPTLAKNARKFFAGDKRVWIVEGDSVDQVSEICSQKLDNCMNATFWLDAHASGPLRGGRTGPNPLIEELEAIRQTGNPNHTILIDDRRLFGSGEWGFLKEEKVMEMLNKINPNYKILYLDGEVPEDIICATVVEREISTNSPVSPTVETTKNTEMMVLEDFE